MIRSLTIGLPIGTRPLEEVRDRATGVIAAARRRLDGAGLSLRTMRFTLPAVDQSGEIEGAIASTLNWVDQFADSAGVRWFCLPLDFVSPGPRRERLAVALDAIGRFKRLFLNLMVAQAGRISVAGINDAADLVMRLSRKTNNGFDNFRVGASCNCPAGTPFFPFSRHEGDSVAFSFALETTTIALHLARAQGSRKDIGLFRDQFIEHLVPELQRIDEIGKDLASEAGGCYLGMDASLAPFPDGKMSVGALIEELLGAPVGSHGSMFITGFLTDALRAALAESGARSVGFNGVMFSLLEDDHLARANSRRCINLDALMGLAALCGCGVDMVPISGASFPEELAAVMLDIATMSTTLAKPLGVRMLPIPGRSANEFTAFNLDFLCDSRVVGLTANDRRFGPEQGALAMRIPLRGIPG